MSKQTLADAKRAYAQKVMSKAPAGNRNTVVVLPEFMEEGDQWMPTESCVIESPNSTKGFGYIALIQKRTVHLKGVEFDNDVFSIQRGKVVSMESKYTPGMLLPGKIVVEDTLIAPNPNDLTQDLKYISAAAREAGIACTIDDQPIYTIKYWDETGTVQDTTITHNNDVVAQVQGATPKANTGMDNAKAKAARLAELKAIPKAKRTQAEKLELAELED